MSERQLQQRFNRFVRTNAARTRALEANLERVSHEVTDNGDLLAHTESSVRGRTRLTAEQRAAVDVALRAALDVLTATNLRGELELRVGGRLFSQDNF